ncbi:MAG: SPOR domain-containing protein [Pontibacterium sp.]
MPNDLARKKRGPRKGAKPKAAKSSTKKAAPARKRKPLFLMLFTLVLTVGFGYFLYSLLANGEQAQTATKPAPAPKAAEPVASQPKQPAKPAVVTEDKKRFEFYEALPKSEVTTADPSQYKSTPRDAISEVAYDLQISSFRDKAAAEQLRAQLILQGLGDVRTSESTNSQGETWFRVVAGPFNNRPKLEAARNKLEKLGYMPIRLKASD